MLLKVERKECNFKEELNVIAINAINSFPLECKNLQEFIDFRFLSKENKDTVGSSVPKKLATIYEESLVTSEISEEDTGAKNSEALDVEWTKKIKQKSVDFTSTSFYLKEFPKDW